MTKIQDIRHRTQFTNKRRSLSAIKNIARHYSATIDATLNLDVIM